MLFWTLAVKLVRDADEDPGAFRLESILLIIASILYRFTPDQLRFIFLHELAHIKRLDIVVGWVATVLQALHWFNPLPNKSLFFAFHLGWRVQVLHCLFSKAGCI